MRTLHAYSLLLIFTAVSLTGCKKPVVINEKQAILFQVDYMNYAWGYEHSGIIIDNNGNVLTYKNPHNWNFADNDFNISESQVRENLGYCSFSGKKISAEELNRYVNHIKNISSSKVTAPRNVAADAGSREYFCYRFSEKTGTYKGYLIKKEGDFSCENLNFYAKKVSSWLKVINDSAEKK